MNSLAIGLGVRFFSEMATVGASQSSASSTLRRRDHRLLAPATTWMHLFERHFAGADLLFHESFKLVFNPRVPGRVEGLRP